MLVRGCASFFDEAGEFIELVGSPVEGRERALGALAVSLVLDDVRTRVLVRVLAVFPPWAFTMSANVGLGPDIAEEVVVEGTEAAVVLAAVVLTASVCVGRGSSSHCFIVCIMASHKAVLPTGALLASVFSGESVFARLPGGASLFDSLWLVAGTAMGSFVWVDFPGVRNLSCSLGLGDLDLCLFSCFTLGW